MAKTKLEMYNLNGQSIIAAANEDGRMIASQVLGGERAEADAAEPAGFRVDPLTEDQMNHFRKHGWCNVE